MEAPGPGTKRELNCRRVVVLRKNVDVVQTDSMSQEFVGSASWKLERDAIDGGAARIDDGFNQLE